MAEDLHERDFYVRAMEQAERLRRRGAGVNALDHEKLAEEMEALARSQARACESLLRRIVEHILKILAAGESDLRDVVYWRREISGIRSSSKRR